MISRFRIAISGVAFALAALVLVQSDFYPTC
jgi:hypothetical protein